MAEPSVDGVLWAQRMAAPLRAWRERASCLSASITCALPDEPISISYTLPEELIGLVLFQCAAQDLVHAARACCKSEGTRARGGGPRSARFRCVPTPKLGGDPVVPGWGLTTQLRTRVGSPGCGTHYARAQMAHTHTERKKTLTKVLNFSYHHPA
eukprot:3403353-Prymnesium_polylepis.2